MNNDKYGNIEPFEFWFSFLERSISLEVNSILETCIVLEIGELR